jgi:hypothetical protein
MRETPAEAGERPDGAVDREGKRVVTPSKRRPKRASGPMARSVAKGSAS